MVDGLVTWWSVTLVTRVWLEEGRVVEGLVTWWSVTLMTRVWLEKGRVV